MCLAAAAAQRADNVGGPWRARGRGAGARAIAAAFPVALVPAARARATSPTKARSTPLPRLWPRASFERFGTFDEALVRTRTDEHNCGIVRGGGRVWQSAAIRSGLPASRLAGALWGAVAAVRLLEALRHEEHGQAGGAAHRVPAVRCGAAVAALLVFAGVTAPLLLLLARMACWWQGCRWRSRGVVRGACCGGCRRWWPRSRSAMASAPWLGPLGRLRHGRGRERFASLTR